MYDTKIELTHGIGLPLSLSEAFDEGFASAVKKCKTADSLLDSANEHKKYGEEWFIHYECDEYTELMRFVDDDHIRDEKFGNVENLFVKKKNFINIDTRREVLKVLKKYEDISKETDINRLRKGMNEVHDMMENILDSTK